MLFFTSLSYIGKLKEIWRLISSLWTHLLVYEMMFEFLKNIDSIFSHGQLKHYLCQGVSLAVRINGRRCKGCCKVLVARQENCSQSWVHLDQEKQRCWTFWLAKTICVSSPVSYWMSYYKRPFRFEIQTEVWIWIIFIWMYYLNLPSLKKIAISVDDES